jgi:hypothetical protein
MTDAFEQYAAMTYSDVAAAMGVSRSRVQQLEAAAMRKLRLITRIEELAPSRSREIIAGLRGKSVHDFVAVVEQLKRECALAGALCGAAAGAVAGAHPLWGHGGRRDAACSMTGEGVLTATAE